MKIKNEVTIECPFAENTIIKINENLHVEKIKNINRSDIGYVFLLNDFLLKYSFNSDSINGNKLK